MLCPFFYVLHFCYDTRSFCVSVHNPLYKLVTNYGVNGHDFCYDECILLTTK